MEPYQTYQANLSYAAGLAGSLESLRDLQYEQIAQSAMRDWKRDGTDPLDTDRIAALYLTGDPFTDPASLEGLADGALCTPDFARFCSHFTAGLPEGGLFQPAENEEDVPEGRTAYMQNSYTDRAWRQFAAGIPHMTAEYFTGYPAICEEVYSGRCHFCILPLHTSADGLLVSFRKLIGRYDLKIALETQVEMADESVMRFALVGRGLTVRPLGKAPERMDLSVILPEEGSAGALLSACEALGAHVNAIHTVPVEYAEELQEFCLELNITDASLAAMSVFLEASQLRYTVEGLYSMM